MDFDMLVKLKVYETITETTWPPTSAEVGAALGATAGEVEESFRRLYAKRLLVPEPGDPSRIRMAPPFSGIETPFRVQVGDKAFYANCVWDALGVPAALREDALVHASDAWTAEPMTLEVSDGRPVPRECVVHFAVPAARWWHDIIHT